MESNLIGAAVHSDDLKPYRQALYALPVLELENYLFPGFADQDQEKLAEIQARLAGYAGGLVVSGPYIDLNPASPDRLVLEAVRRRFRQAHDFALALGASEIVFLSTFLPIIYLASYEEDWVSRSIAFWKSFLGETDPQLTFSLGNTFEFTPGRLVSVAEGVGRPNFRLAFDIGHFLVYSQVSIAAWAQAAGPHCSTVYVHSNDGRIDTHEPPFRGRLRCEHLATFATAAPPTVKFIAKMSDKKTLGASLAWMRSCLNRDR